MYTRLGLYLACMTALVALAACGGGGGGGHKKVIIHVPVFVKNHKHTHTIVKHIHHKDGGGGGDHYEVLGYTYGEPKPAPHFGGGHGWGAADEGSYGDSPVSFEGSEHGGYGLDDGGSAYAHEGY